MIVTVSEAEAVPKYPNDKFYKVKVDRVRIQEGDLERKSEHSGGQSRFATDWRRSIDGEWRDDLVSTT